MRRLYIIGSIACLFAACKPSTNITTPTSAGEATFTNYLAIGNGFTAGYGDSSLTVSGQLHSYPQRLFEQFSTVPESDYRRAQGPFVHPLLFTDNGYPNAKKILGYSYNNCTADTMLWPVDYPGFAMDTRDDQRFTSTVNAGQINNIGVPGIRVVDYMVGGYHINHNRYAWRFFNEPTNAAYTPLDELSYRVRTQHPTFFSFWLGTNDVLDYALAGGQGNGTGHALPVSLNYFSTNDISNYNIFFKTYDTVLKVALHTGAEGVLINVPDVTKMPYFTAVPARGLHITRQSHADSLHQFYFSATWQKAFEVGDNFFIIRDNGNNVRQAIPGELILMSVPLDSINCAGWGSTTPIPAQYVLTTDELQHIRTATDIFNSHIREQAALWHLAYVDMNAFMATLTPGYAYNTINYTGNFISGGAYSLDGIHPTPRGYALIANHIIASINSFYNARIPGTDANKYPGVIFPN
jgi:lysophospholipase L1-like esterase